ncbi:hypothetical protein CC80DRAFT_228894 [Byssothecium circinans]|uniref:Transmembrane protein n=1 Tax=Byssothecium circinans TaxID=147558 RepID=A0A6A5TFK2_9PLEO|nr:hypothetical protein CC80DRAFT_228894 [Byssothecium circinans]
MRRSYASSLFFCIVVYCLLSLIAYPRFVYAVFYAYRKSVHRSLPLPLSSLSLLALSLLPLLAPAVAVICFPRHGLLFVGSSLIIWSLVSCLIPGLSLPPSLSSSSGLWGARGGIQGVYGESTRF